MTSVDPKISLEIEKTKSELLQSVSELKSELRNYADTKSDKARRSSLAVLGFVTAALGLGGALGINSLIGNHVTSSLEGKVESIVSAELPKITPIALSEIVPKAVAAPIEQYLSSDDFAATIDVSLSNAVESEFQARVPDSVVQFIQDEQAKAELLAERAEALRQRLESASEQPFKDVDFRKIADDAVAASWAPGSLLGQIQAQATCVALSPGGSWVTAVPRTCSNEAPTCEELCSQIRTKTTDGQISGANNNVCTAALHIYSNPPTDEVDTVGLKTFTYGGCGGRHCGPNYCCCSSF